MSNSQNLASSFKSEVMLGQHALGASTLSVARSTSSVADTVNAALYQATATINAATTTYTATGEVSGSGYTAGGVAVTNATAPATSGTSGIWTPSASIVFPTITIATPFDTLLLYNATQLNGGNGRAIGSYTFTATTVAAGTVTFTMPANVPGTSLIQLS
jgi:hypothetical protein